MQCNKRTLLRRALGIDTKTKSEVIEMEDFMNLFVIMHFISPPFQIRKVTEVTSTLDPKQSDHPDACSFVVYSHHAGTPSGLPVQSIRTRK